MSMDGTDLDELDELIDLPAEGDGEYDDEPAPKGKSVRDSIEKAWEKHGGELSEERKQASERRRNDYQHDKTDRKNKGRDRGPDNRDTSRDAPREAAPAKQNTAPAVEPAEAAPTPQLQPPIGWSKEAKDVWAKLPPAVQAAVTKRETDMNNGAKQLQERYGGIHRLSQTLAPRFQRYNLTPDRGFANMASWFEAIENNPAAGIRELAKLYNVQLGAQAPAPAPGTTPNGQSPPQPRPQADPRLDHLWRWAAEMNQNRSTEVQNAKLSAWSPNKPHFDAVRSLMGDMLEVAVRNQDPRFLNDAGSDIDLDKLYQAAIQSHPEIGPQVIREKLDEERKARDARVARARQAGGSLRPGTPGSGPRAGEQANKLPKGAGVRAHIQQAWDELRSS